MIYFLDRYYSKSISRCSQKFNNYKNFSWSGGKEESYRASFSKERICSFSRFWEIEEDNDIS